MFGRKSSRANVQLAGQPTLQRSDQAPERAQANQTITFLIGDRSISIDARLPRNEEGVASLLEIALEARLPIEHSCGGFGTCGTCRVLIEAGADDLTEREEIESEMAADRKFTDDERLACQTNLIHKNRAHSLRIRIPENSETDTEA